MVLPQRPPAHRIDTAAVRLVLIHLNEDLIIRSMEDRDYGIDLQLEQFDENNPTGNLALIQVKGCQKEFGEKITLKFPVKTILYAQLFNYPFFVFYTSVNSRKTMFIWLQKYVDVNKDFIDQKWKNENKMEIEFPAGNDLEGNKKKISDIIQAQRRHRAALEFLKIDENLRRYGRDAINNKTDNAKFCAEEALRLPSVADFFEGTQIEHKHLIKYSKKLNEIFSRVPRDKHFSKKNLEYFNEVIESLDTVKMEYMQSDGSDRAIENVRDKLNNDTRDIPY